jgi:ABC-type transport system involved in multi-copper enzyme maturation permease subunit
VLGIIVALAIAALTAETPTDADIAQARARYEKNVQRCLNGGFLPEGAAVPAGYDTLDEYCRDAAGPSIDGIRLSDLEELLEGISTFVVLLGVLLAASLGGADWTSNTMTTLLTWEPRRARVFFMRALVVALVVCVITFFLQAVFDGVYWVVAVTRGTTLFLPGGFWGDVLATMARVSLTATAIGLVAYVLAMIGRSTVSSLGVLFGYLVLFEGVIAGFKPSIQGNLLIRAGSVIVSQQPIIDTSDSYDYANPSVLMDVQRAWIVVAVYLVVLGAISLLQYERRDVT